MAVLGAAAQRVEAEEEEEEEGEVLDRHRCLLALAALRHAKWFQVGTHSLPVFLPDASCSLTILAEGILATGPTAPSVCTDQQQTDHKMMLEKGILCHLHKRLAVFWTK